MKNLLKIAILLLFTIILNSCSKVEENIQSNINNNAINTTKSNARLGTSSFDSASYYLNLGSPVRDILMYNLKNGSSNVSTMLYTGGGGFPPPPATCGGITITGTFTSNPPTGWCGTAVPPTYVPGMKDYWNNDIWFTGKYGTDPRQMYYVYYPPNKTANSPIVVLIHGGAWYSGPNPATINGFNSTFTSSGTENSNNIVKNLLAQGYVVVAPLYRLVKYGDNNTDIMANTITIQDQISDIDAAITHMKTNFPGCLNLNTNSVQVLGESAGAHLALMFSYTRANKSYVKSVVSVAGPTNINQFSNWLMAPTFPYTCSTDFMLDNPNTTTYTHFPYNMIYDPNAATANLTNSGFVNPLACGVANIFKYTIYPHTNLLFWDGVKSVYPGSATSNNTAKRVINTFRLLESGIRQVITTSTITTEFDNVSPCFVLNASRIVPTFIIHGTDDWLVPYTKATNTMDTRLSSTGGLIGTYSSTTGSAIPVSNTYATTTNKHIIKLYTNSNHDVATNTQTQPDILTWFNGHK